MEHFFGMRPFAIFFTEKEGSTPLVHLLDGFERISIVHADSEAAWEPFDTNCSGRMPIRDLEGCLHHVFGPAPVDMDALNALYLKTAPAPLAAIPSGTAVGFKMRFRPPRRGPWGVPGPAAVTRQVERALTTAQRRAFRHRMFRVLREHDVTVFIAVRQDILRWSLSKYHGDGTGRPGHLQFKLAQGKISRDEIGKIHVERERLQSILRTCRETHDAKRRLKARLDAAGIRTAVLRYEDFLADQHTYLANILETIEVEPAEGEIDQVIAQGSRVEKVHADDLEEFVENADEVIEEFGDEFVAW